VTYDKLLALAQKRRQLEKEKLRRHIEMGYIKGEVHPNGSISYQTKPKGIRNWYDTRTLINRVEKRMDMNGSSGGERYCPINGKWQLQIRGKHMRRLLKARPHWKQVGRKIIDMENVK